MSSLRADLKEIDHFDRLLDSVLLIVFNKIGDVKALGRCCVVFRRFNGLVPQVDNVVVRVDCVISDEDASSEAASADKNRGVFSNFVRFVFGGIVEPLQALCHFLGPKKNLSTSTSSSFGGGRGAGGAEDEDMEAGGVTHHSPMQVMKNFSEIRRLQIELPSGELGINSGVLLKWRADRCNSVQRVSCDHRRRHSAPELSPF